MEGRIEQTATTVIVYKQEVLLKGHTGFKKCLPVGGHVEPGELYHEAALREIEEECGKKVRLYDPLGPLPHTSRVQMIAPIRILRYFYPSKTPGGPQRVIDDYLYYASADDKDLAPKAGETDPLFWLTRAELRQEDVHGFAMTHNVRELCLEAIYLIGT